MRGVIINQVAWFLPYVYVAIVARHLPWYVWAFIALVVTYSAAFLVIRLRQGRVPGRLPRFLRRRLVVEVDQTQGPTAGDSGTAGGPSVVVASMDIAARPGEDQTT